MLEIERGRTRSHSVENSRWKSLWTCRENWVWMNEYHTNSFCAKIVGCHLKSFPASPYWQFMTYEQYFIHNLWQFEMPCSSSLLSRWKWKLSEYFRTGSMLCYIVEKNFRNWFVFRSYAYIYIDWHQSHLLLNRCVRHADGMQLGYLALGWHYSVVAPNFMNVSAGLKMKWMTHTQTARQTRMYFCC